MKICTKCGSKRKNSDFYKNTNGKLRSWCRECHIEYQKRKNKAEPVAKESRYNRDFVLGFSITKRFPSATVDEAQSIAHLIETFNAAA